MLARKPTDTVSLKLRFSESLRRKIEKSAKKADDPVSLNSEIIRRLESSFERQGWQAERSILLLALKVVLLANPSEKEAYAQALEAIQKLESYGEGDGKWKSRPVNTPPATAGETALQNTRKKPRTG
jgi:hypothetical protein